MDKSECISIIEEEIENFDIFKSDHRKLSDGKNLCFFKSFQREFESFHDYLESVIPNDWKIAKGIDPDIEDAYYEKNKTMVIWNNISLDEILYKLRIEKSKLFRVGGCKDKDFIYFKVQIDNETKKIVYYSLHYADIYDCEKCYYYE